MWHKVWIVMVLVVLVGLLAGCMPGPGGTAGDGVTAEQYEYYQLSMAHATASGALLAIRLADTDREIISDELWHGVIQPLIQESNEAIARLRDTPPGELRLQLMAEVNGMLARLAAQQSRLAPEPGRTSRSGGD